MKLPAELPRRVQVLNSICGSFMRATDAIELLRALRAREIYVNGEFIGIELGKQDQPAEAHRYIPEDLPALELPGLRFKPPASAIGHMIRHTLAETGLLA